MFYLNNVHKYNLNIFKFKYSLYLLIDIQHSYRCISHIHCLRCQLYVNSCKIYISQNYSHRYMIDNYIYLFHIKNNLHINHILQVNKENIRWYKGCNFNRKGIPNKIYFHLCRRQNNCKLNILESKNCKFYINCLCYHNNIHWCN